MDDVESSLNQVAGILARSGLVFQASGDGHSFRLLFTTSAVFVTTERLGDAVVVTLVSPVVSGIDRAGVAGAAALNLIPALNAGHRFLKFLLDENGDLLAVYDLLGIDLSGPPLVHAIYVMAAAAETLGERLADSLGGKRYAAVLETQTDGGDPDGE